MPPAAVSASGVLPCNFQNKTLNLTFTDVNAIIISFGNKQYHFQYISKHLKSY